MSEIYLNNTTLSENGTLCLKDFFDKVEKTLDIELVDTVAYQTTIGDCKFFSTWLTVEVYLLLMIVKRITVSLVLCILTINTMEKISLDYEGNVGYVAGTFLLRTTVSMRNKNILTDWKLPTQE